MPPVEFNFDIEILYFPDYVARMVILPPFLTQLESPWSQELNVNCNCSPEVCINSAELNFGD